MNIQIKTYQTYYYFVLGGIYINRIVIANNFLYTAFSDQTYDPFTLTQNIHEIIRVLETIYNTCHTVRTVRIVFD